METKQMQQLSSMVTVNVKHDFSDTELLQKSSILAQTVKDKENVEAEKKMVMSEFKNNIDKLGAEIKLISGHITNGFMYTDKPAELWLDYENSERIYIDKHDGETILKKEPFHPSDYQKKIDFDEQERVRNGQIDENNEAGDFADGIVYNKAEDVIAAVIEEKKKSNFKIKPVPKNNLGDDYGKNAEVDNTEDPFDELPE